MSENAHNDKVSRRSYRTAIIVLLGVLLIYGVLVATHRGEFWPFSIYPMFSSAGGTWTRVVVRDVTGDSLDSFPQRAMSLQHLPGRPVPLDEVGVPASQNDLAVFMEEGEGWSAARREVLHSFFLGHASNRHLLLYRVTGRLGDYGVVEVWADPVALIMDDTLLINTKLMIRTGE